MKKNLLFALSVFLITIVGLLVFSEASNKAKQETSKIEKIDQSKESTTLLSFNQ